MRFQCLEETSALRYLPGTSPTVSPVCLSPPSASSVDPNFSDPFRVPLQRLPTTAKRILSGSTSTPCDRG
ncbi:uncharacterized protein EI90DRAFT_3049321, partial [Cantharellus anzutake]|uniref:uncharacterized protein n=1 Tax=Cantharellus anzutake TaxID=1750568 RepID=UPI0019031556